MERSRGNKQSSNNALLYFCIGTFSVGLLGGLYYLYCFMTNVEEISEELQVEIEELKQLILENNSEISTDLAIRILALINKRVDEIMKNSKAQLDEKRRSSLNNEKEYSKHCMEYFNTKESTYNKATNQILGHFNMQISDLKEIMDQITAFEVEKKIFLYHKPSFPNNIIPDKAKVKDSFIFFGNKFIDEMTKLNAELEHSPIDKESEESSIYKMLELKLRIDDTLFMKYGLTETQIRFMIYEYSLLEDKEVKSINDKISRYEESLYL